MVEILRSKDQTGPLWWRFSSAIVALYSLLSVSHSVHRRGICTQRRLCLGDVCLQGLCPGGSTYASRIWKGLHLRGGIGQIILRDTVNERW